MPTPSILSDQQVIDRILDLIKAVPQAGKGLPAGHDTAAFWKKLFYRNERTRRLLETYRELPAFTDYAPKRGDVQGWRRLMKKHFDGPPTQRPAQALPILNRMVLAAKPHPPAPKIKRWRDAFAPTHTLQRVRPAESNAYLHNPHRGTTTFQRFQGDDVYASWIWSDTHGPLTFKPNAPVRDNIKFIPRTTLTYCRCPWSWLEPKKGKYNWHLLDQALLTAHNRGQTVQFRFQPFTIPVDYSVAPCTAKRHPPKVSVNVPDWYWDTGAKWIKNGPYLKNEPDSNDPKYLKHFGDFVRAFAKRYDGHPDLESVDVAYAGVWGESGGNTTPKTAAKLVDVYLKAFKKTMLLHMLGTPGCKYGGERARATKRRMGFRADCVGDLRALHGKGVPPELCFNHTFDAYPLQIQKEGMKHTWETAPVTMETCGTVASWFMDGYDLDVIIREAYRYHTSVFMPKNVFYPRAFMERLVEFDKKLGYRFVVRQVMMPLEFKPGQKINLQFYTDNVGCAPIYRPYTLAVRFRQGSVSKVVRLKADIRGWLPGHNWFEEKIITPTGFKKGEAEMDLVIVDEKNQPKVWLALDARTKDGWHPLAHIDVV